jgi:hypothetical protein
LRHTQFLLTLRTTATDVARKLRRSLGQRQQGFVAPATDVRVCERSGADESIYVVLIFSASSVIVDLRDVTGTKNAAVKVLLSTVPTRGNRHIISDTLKLGP